jgi:iron complex transport system permease protein
MKNATVLLLLLLALAASVAASFTLGRYPLPLADMGGYLLHALGLGPALGPDLVPDLTPNLAAEAEEAMRRTGVLLVDIRLPRILAALLVGSALAVSGATFQAMFINPLVSPGLLGVLAGASFGAALGMLLSTRWVAVQGFAFAFGLIAVGLSLLLARLYKGDKLLLLILSGVISGALFTALLSVIKYLADPYDQLPAIVYWLMGGFSMISLGNLAPLAPGIILGIAVILFLGKYLNVLTMGDEEARALGLRVRGIRLTFIVAATLLGSMTVAIGGIIGWVGLVIPHMGRMLVGPDNRVLLPCCALMGALFLLVVDNVSRQLFTVEVPLGILTSLLGIPAFAAVLRVARKGWS